MRKTAKICVSLIAVSGVITCALAQPGPGGPPPGPASPGGTAFAQGQFEEAESAYEKAVAANPADAAALAGLARARLYNGKEDQAMELAQKALAIAPGNPVATATLNMAQVRKSTFTPDRFVIKRSNQSPAIVKFLATDPLPVVSLTIGTKTVNFLIDTGAPNIVISPDLAKELGLVLEDAGQGVFAGGLQAQVRRTLVPKMEIGGIEISNVPAAVIGGGGLSPGGIKTDGIIGTGLLMHFLSTLDYCRGQLVLAPRTDSAKFQAQAASDNVVRMWLVGDHFIFARGRLGQAPEGLFLVDTGLAGAGLMPNKAALDEAGITVDMSNPKTGMGGGGPVQFVDFSASASLGKLSRNDVRGNFTLGGGNPLGGMPFKTNGIISHSFFRQSRLTFDFEAMKLVTQNCAT